MSLPIELRHYQCESVEGLRANIREGIKNQVLCSPTGSGKTVIALYLLDECRNKNKRAIFVVERLPLVEQTSAMLDKFGIDHGVIQGNHWRTRPGEKIQVATAQTLDRRGWPDADLIIVDECHVMHKDTLKKIVQRDSITIGLTATPFTRGMGKFYDRVVNVTTSNKLMDEGFLVPAKIFAASQPDMTGAKVVAGEWTDAECSSRAMPIIGDCVAEYLKHGNDKKFIAFGVDVEHCKEMQKQFMAAGVICELHTYQDGDKIREANMVEFRKPNSYIRGLISVSALSRGLDVPDVSCVIMCRPLRKAFSEFIQVIGRGLRPYPNKEHCIILDHSGNYSRFFGKMQDLFEEGVHELDTGEKEDKEKKKKEDKEKEPVKCPKCHHVHMPMPACPVCGNVYPKKEAVTHEAGELHEVGSIKRMSTDEKRTLYGELKWIASSRNWSKGALAHKFREIAGVWPNNYEDAPMLVATQKTINKVQQLHIAWLNSERYKQWKASRK